VKRAFTLVRAEDPRHDERSRAELETLHGCARALADARGENPRAPGAGTLARQDEDAVGLGHRLAALRDEVGSSNDPSPSSDELADLQRAPRADRHAPPATGASRCATQLVPPRPRPT